MIKSLLLDLDDTLLGNPVDVFMDQYFKRLNVYASLRFDEKTFLPCLIQATQDVITNTDPRYTNDQVFWRSFEALTGEKRADMEPFFQVFYEEEFAHLKPYTEVRPAAVKLVRAAQERGLAVVVATHPLFPRVAIEHRLEWAGLPVDAFNFALVTSYENMHAAKPQPAYYREILSVIGCEPHEALMAGDDWENDIAPAAEVGLFTYWIAPEGQAPLEPGTVHGQGSLDDLAELVARGGLERLPQLTQA